MSEHNLNSLNPARFLELPRMREAAIISATNELSWATPPANKLALALHPKSQALKVVEILESAPDVRSYICAPDTERGCDSLAYFQAGQYISVEVEINGVKYSRPYSLSSSPRDALAGKYMISVKRVPGGIVSGFILDNFKIGTAFSASSPMGFFTYEPLRDAPHVIGIAGGSGITPFFSLVAAIADGDEDFDLTLLLGFRRESEILFRDEFSRICRRCPRVKVIYVISDEVVPGLEHGYIGAELVGKYMKNGENSIFVCGPAAMSAHLAGELPKLGLPGKYIRYEVQGEGFRPEAAGKLVNISVKIGDNTYAASGDGSQSILRILENAGIKAPSKCRSGECGFCRSRLISGEVYIPESTDRRRLADDKFGYIHPCVSFASSDIEIEVSLD